MEKKDLRMEQKRVTKEEKSVTKEEKDTNVSRKKRYEYIIKKTLRKKRKYVTHILGKKVTNI